MKREDWQAAYEPIPTALHTRVSSTLSQLDKEEKVMKRTIIRTLALALCAALSLSLLAACLDKVSPQIIRGCTFLGGCTLEIYAVHAFAFQVFRDALSDDILYGTDKRWLLLSVLSVLFAVLLARVMARLTAKTQKQPTQQT